MNEIGKANLSDKTKFTLNEINKLKIIYTKKLIKENHAVRK